VLSGCCQDFGIQSCVARDFAHSFEVKVNQGHLHKRGSSQAMCVCVLLFISHSHLHACERSQAIYVYVCPIVLCVLQIPARMDCHLHV